MGRLNASQNATKRAAFCDAGMSRVPASERGWLATIPTGYPPTVANEVTTFVAQRGSSLAVNTTASTTGPHTDFNASGQANNADLSFLAVNFFQVDETCGGSYNGAAPMERIAVRQLRRMGLGSQAIADINNDGWVDSTDIALLMQGVEPGSKRPQPTLTTSW